MAGARREPVAIVGIGCRSRAAFKPESFRELTPNGRDVVGEILGDRFEIDPLPVSQLGTSPSRWYWRDPVQRRPPPAPLADLEQGAVRRKP
jgi:acyl transferase domain-containing protein